MRLSGAPEIIFKLAIASMIGTALTALAWFTPGNYYHDLAALVNKRDLLASRTPPRIIFIGGSNLTTMRGNLIEKELNRRSRISRSVVNLGLWGGLNIERYLEEVFPYLKAGDIVIICQEYATLLDPKYFRYIRENDEAPRFFFLMTPGKSIKDHLSECRLIDLSRTIILLNQIKIKTYLAIILESKYDRPCTGGFYRYAEQYNDSGDRIRPFKVMRPLNGSGARFGEPKTDDLAYLQRFNERAGLKGVRFILAFPPFPETDYLLNRVPIGYLEILFDEGFGIELLNEPWHTVYPEGCFADSVNHLTPECERRRSAMIIERLAPRIR